MLAFVIDRLFYVCNTRVWGAAAGLLAARPGLFVVCVLCLQITTCHIVLLSYDRPAISLWAY